MRVFALLLMLVGVSSSAFGAYYMKHPWGGGNWEWKQLDGSNKVTAAYGGSGVNVHTSANDNGAQWFGSPTLVGSPTKGTQCVFEYNPSSNTVTITAVGGGTTISSLYIIGDAVKGWNDASKLPIFVAMTAGTSGEYYYDGLYADREFKFTSQNNWSDASQTIFNDASADNTKSVGATASKVKNGNDTNAKVSLEEGYVEPIKFFVNTSTKKFWAVATKAQTFDLTASATDYDTASAPTSLTLKVTSDNTTTGDFMWYKSTDGTNFVQIAGVTGDTYTLTGNDVPLVDTYFKVKRAKADNTTPALEYLEDTVKISVFQTCGEGTKGSNLFKITFDDDSKLKTLLGAGSRMKYDAMVSGYTYVEAPYKINDGQYAIVTEPLYCGYGTGGKEECGTDISCIEQRIKNDKNERWYRGFRDHTQNKGGANPPFGGMLLINFGNISATNEESGVAFSRILTPDETKDFSEGATLTFSAYMASAAVKEKPNVIFKPINAELKIQFKKTGSTTWENVANIKSQVDFDDNWKRFETSWKITDIEGEFRVVIKNNGSTGDGNDLLIDDISLDLCSPTISVEFSDIQADSYTFTSVDEEISVRVPKVNFGSISDPCLMLFGIDKNGKYNFIAEMLDDNGNYYVAKNSINGSMLIEIADDGSRNIAPMQLQAVVSEKIGGTCNDDVMSGVQDGTYTPGADPMVVFSSNTLSVDLTCQESQLILLEGEPTSICYSEDMIFPELKLTSNNISSSVSLDILVNDDVVLQGIPFVPEQGTNVMVLNVSELYLQATGNPYLPSQGVQKVTVKITESFADGILCERIAEGEVSIKIVNHSDAPAGKRPGEHYSYNMCKTEGADAEIDDDKFFFIDLILEGEDKEGLVWLDKDGKIVPEENAFFYADLVQDDSIRVYRDPAAGCPSDTTTIYYRVKEITRTPVVNNYLDCAIEGDPIALSSRVEGADTYKYLLFINGTDTLTTFDPSVPGSKTYEVVASYDEINSASNNYCEATTELTVKVKSNATAANIIANDTLVCPNAELVLLAKAKFAKEQTNVKLTWYADESLSRIYAYGETFKYFVLEEAYKQNPHTVYVTVQSDDYCENVPSEAKPVVISQKEEVPSLAISPASAEVVIGAMPGFTVTPEDAKYDLYVNDVKVSANATTYKPYINSEYKLVYEGECGSTYATAHVAVQWPTVFTPYVKDGRNDTFVQDMDPNFYTQIFTRFGTKIYEGENGWDGSINGLMNGSKEVAAPGVYYYVVQLPDGNVKKGTIEVFKY